MLLNIIFSYNRAMQLDYLLQSILERFKIDNYEIAIIYHTTGEHNKGYQLLQDNYKEYSFIKFYERKEGFDLGILPAINCRTHLRFFNKYHFKNKKRDNFKGLLENIMAATSHEFVMFNTDDGVFIDNIYFSENIQNLIRYNPNVSYRTYVGDNIEGFPDYVQKWGDNYMWDYYHDKVNITHWSYPFAVDGTIYKTNSILSIQNKVAYHNPVTLEGNVVEYVKRNKLLGIGISPIKSKLIGTKLNRVSVDSFNPTIHIQPDYLNGEYLNGYKLNLVFDEINNSNLVPNEVILIKQQETKVIYTIDDKGKNVQNNLGIEGAKIQMD